MTAPDPHRAASAAVRAFARDTNLLVAGRTSRVRGTTQEAAALRELLARLGSRAFTADESGAPGVEFEAAGTGWRALVDGAPIPDRGDAAGRIDFAGRHMPVSRALAGELADSGIVRGLRVGIAMVLEPKTAQLALLLRGAGADVAVYAHPDETDQEVAEALRALGVPVDADAALSGGAERAAAEAFLRRGFDVLLDDGSHLIRLAHESAPDEVDRWIGANEETTSGLTPLRAMHEAGALACPVIAVNDAAMKTDFDNLHGTGQSCAFAIADLLEGVGADIAAQPALVIGYGPVGQGTARRLAALGADVRVAETDPVRALRAIHDGFRTGRAAELADGALVVSATGAPDTIGSDIASRAFAIAVAGGVPGEVSVDEPREPVGAHVERLASSGALLLAGGGCVNIIAAEGNPIEIMDYSFAVQLAGLAHLVRTRPGIGVHPLPREIDERVARTALAARGARVDEAEAAASPADSDWRSPRSRSAGGAA